MSGHSHWAGIKHKKEAADKARGAIFSKLLSAVSVAARPDPNPQFNSRLRAAIDKARTQGVPHDKIDSAIGRVKDAKETLQEITLEAYGPGGAALIVSAITDNKNRTISELKKILSENECKAADPGSVLWAFKKEGEEWVPQFKQDIPENLQKRISDAITALDEHPDVQKTFTNAVK